jgi:hypothetical protein
MDWINFTNENGGTGGVPRSSCRFIGAWRKPLLGITEMEVRDEVLFVKIWGLTYVIVILEMDCLEMVNLWKSRHNSRSIVAPLL